ncbi:UNVERIFIED_CONTAM: hypothetical protein GTU68_050025 [Idotea baltica]|nr:hypothetical protein [Idotea baltica]
MPVKIRLQRHGKKGKPFYWVVAADARAKRDGKFLEKLGIYNPNTNPATIELNIDNSVQWLQNGAQPTDTARAILSYKGVMLKHHLLGGLRKAKVGGLDKAKAEARAKALEAEKEVNAKREADAAAALAPEPEVPTTPEGQSAEAEVEAVEAAPTPEAVVETPETPQPDVANADTTPVAPVVEKEVIEAKDDMNEAPSVEEVIEASDEEVKPAKTEEKE